MDLKIKRSNDTMDIKVDVQLDARGLSCPMPLLKTKKAIKEMKSGEVIEILGTDPGSKKDLPDFARKSGHEWLGVEEDPSGFYRFYIRKG